MRLISDSRSTSADGPAADEVLTSDPQLDWLLRNVAGASVPHADAAAENVAVDPPLESGAAFGHFLISEMIGRGGMGVVYRARDVHLDRDVALKVLPRGAHPNERSQEVLLREARTAAALNHPNIASIYQAGEVEGRAYLAMELIRGASLRAQLGARPALRWLDRLEWARGLARALAALHAHGWVHQDIKPENVMIAGDATNAQPNDVKLLDFGLARAPASGEGAPLERVGGTLGYMAPEQITATTPDARADIFAFGVVLQELLVGERASLVKKDLIVARCGRRARSLVHVLDRCLARSPSDRYASGVELAAALDRACARIQTPTRWPLVALVTAGALAASGFVAFTQRGAATPVVAGPSLRLTGNALARPISAAAISWAGDRFAYVDEEGLAIGSTSAPSAIKRPALAVIAGAEVVEAIPHRDEWGVVARTETPGMRGYFVVAAEGASATLVHEGPFAEASRSADGKWLAMLNAPGVTVRHMGTGESWTVPIASSRACSAARFSPDSTRLAIGCSEVGDTGRTRALEVWALASRKRVHEIVSPRFAQPYYPIVFAWSREGDLVYAMTDRPGQGSGAAIWRARSGAAGAYSATSLLSLERQYLAGISVAADGRILTLRHDVQARVRVADVSEPGVAPHPRSVTDADFDERVTGWASSTALWQMSYREHVPRLRRRELDGPEREDAIERSRRGWAQAWPTVAPAREPNGPTRLLYWAAEGSPDDELPRWRLLLAGPDGVSPVRTPSEPREPLSVAGTPPTSVRVKCQVQAAVCLLGALSGPKFSLHRLALDGGEPTRLFELTGADPFLQAWQIEPDGRRITMGTPDGKLATYALDGERLATRTLSGARHLRSLAIAGDGRTVYVSGVFDGAPEFRVLRVTPDREEILWADGATLFGDLTLSPDDKRLAFVERAIDTDVWVTPFVPAAR